MSQRSITSHNGPFIRPARRGDLQRIMELEGLCFDADTRESEAAYRERIETYPEGFLVLETATDGRNARPERRDTAAGEELAGFICSELWRRSAYEDSAPVTADLFSLGHSIRERFRADGNELYVSSLAVDPACRGKGYGELLFQTLIARTRAARPQLDSVILLVGEKWAGARKIYERDGFATIAVLKGFFGGDSVEPYDGIVMRK